MPRSECKCEECKGACSYNPGWFMPGEAEKAAEYLGISLQEFFNQYLGINWWVADNDIFVLAPAIIDMTPGKEYPGDPRGECIFFKKDLCAIHVVKPFECAECIHTESEGVSNQRHHEVAEAWKDHQKQIEELLGRKPESADFGWLNLWT